MLKGVPIITTGSPKSRENGNPGMPIFTGCVYFHDTGIPPLECYCSQIAFLAVLKPLSLSPNDLVAAVTLENEALLYRYASLLSSPP